MILEVTYGWSRECANKCSAALSNFLQALDVDKNRNLNLIYEKDALAITMRFRQSEKYSKNTTTWIFLDIQML